MGNAIKRMVTKPFRSFNVENRARRVIEMEKPIQAPRHHNFEDATPSHVKDEIRKKIVNKSEDLHQRLQDVRVVSEGENVKIERNRNLPQDRQEISEPEYGFREPKTIPKGKISFSKATELLKKHATSPAKYGATQAANEYQLDLKDAQNIIKYFIPMRVIDPKNAKEVNDFVEDQKRILQKLNNENKKELPSG